MTKAFSATAAAAIGEVFFDGRAMGLGGGHRKALSGEVRNVGAAEQAEVSFDQGATWLKLDVADRLKFDGPINNSRNSMLHRRTGAADATLEGFFVTEGL